MEADKMLDIYIHDYLEKRKLNASMKAFEDEAKVPTNHPAIDAPRGFLFEWWTVFWDTFVYRYKRHQGIAEPCSEAQIIRAQQPQGGQSQHQSASDNDVVTGKRPRTTMVSASKNMPLAKEIHGLMSASKNQSATGPEGSLIGNYGPTRGLTNLPLQGWPLMQGVDQIQPGYFQQQQALMHQNILPKELGFLLNYPNFGIGNDAQINSVDHTLRSDGLQRPVMLPKASKHQTPQKRKQPLPSSDLVSNSGTIKTAKDTVPTPDLPHNDKIDTDVFLNDGPSDANNDMLLSTMSSDPDIKASNGFTFSEIGCIDATSVDCCHISFDGKRVATGGQDKKARLWCTGSRENNATFDEHSEAITDIRFSPSMLRLATSSRDKTIRIWDVENPSYSIRTFAGHTTSVTSFDFHSNNEDIICSCDENEIRYWTIKNAGCIRVEKGGASIVRFQPGVGKCLAAAVGNSVSIIDLENHRACRPLLKGHKSNVQSICWDSSGERLASVSEDLVRVWKIDSNGGQNCIHELSVGGKKFRCAAFHPCYSSLLIVGSYQTMELWNMAENKMMTLLEEPISALETSFLSGFIASAGQNGLVKLWK